MILSWPGAKKPQVSKDLIELVDIFPTFYESTGGKKKFDFDGKSLWKLVRGEKWNRNQIGMELGLNYPGSDNKLSYNGIITSKYKYAWFAKEKKE